MGAISLAIISKLVFRVSGYIKLHKSNMSVIDKMTGLEFERYVAGLLMNRGYTNVRLTEKYDLGVDIIAVKDGIRWGIQVKRYSGLVKADAVRQVVTALRKYDCDRAMVITNSTYSMIAKDLAISNDCVLIDRVILLQWVH
jgi:restriction system protein